ncbi:aldo/keto reductase [Microbacterium sp. BK668]|uniref:aldo/keto reductase n=1 Tax=Microbacterium sp. BK668 TaxID=2512118 RepID=UPI00105CF80D|nr:aldo/keto reductase [Microbacterium sp. BK668]TDN90714.1 diketogulonate reductase-like aldo/keto reductase [Microbacterium sp. BK668]
MTTSVTLSNGLRMPQLGLGVYLVSDPAVCEASVRTALRAGYRLLDTAFAYRNEAAVGRGIRSSGVPREDIFVTTKLWPSDYAYEKAEAAIGGSLARLDCGPIDLLLLHQPVGDVRGAWRAMEEAVDSGVVRSIGVSNFTTDDLGELLPAARIRPVVDQVELHPHWQQPDLLPFLEREGIAAEAWYPIGHGSRKLLDESAIVSAARAHGKSAVQVILRWHIQRGFVAIPKSTDPAHIAANIDVFDFALTPGEMADIDALGRARPMFRVPRWLLSAVLPLARPRPRP